MNSRWIRLLPALVLAVGIVAATATARFAAGLGVGVLAGPLVLAASILFAGELVRRQSGAPRGMRAAALILAVASLGASAFAARSDPARVVEVLPLLGAGAVVLVLRDGGRSARCTEREATETSLGRLP